MILSTKQLLRPEELGALREKQVINEKEYAYIAGDLLVAENVTTSEKRVLGPAREFLSESNKRVLRG
jgi:hypothetical protein